MAEAAGYFYALPDVSTEALAEQVPAASRVALSELQQAFGKLDWTRENIAAEIKATAARHGLKAGQVMMPLRWLVAGTGHTPAIDAVLLLLGSEVTRARLADGLARLG